MPVDRGSQELLRAIVWRPADATAQRIHRLAENVRDWDSLLKLAREHGVQPMLFSRLSDLGPAIPPDVQNHLRAEYHRNLLQGLANAVELIGLLEALDQQGIPAMPFKGVVLGASIYGDLTTRPAGDLDVLIHHRHLARATSVLQERGCELKTPIRADGTRVDPRGYEYHFERERDGMAIELRWRLGLTEPWFGSGHNLGLDWVWPRRRMTRLAGAEVPDIEPEITLLLLCMHGSKHAWSRLIWICDVAQLLASFPKLDWKEVTREAKRVGLWRTLVLGVLLAHRITGTIVPQPFCSVSSRRLPRAAWRDISKKICSRRPVVRRWVAWPIPFSCWASKIAFVYSCRQRVCSCRKRSCGRMRKIAPPSIYHRH
jgi:hypothetical protein